MTTFVNRGSGPGNRWGLPLILAIIVAAVIAGAILWPRIRSTAARPTSTARVIVVTPSPAAGTAGKVPSARTGSTPLPGATPVPTVNGLLLGMITHPAAEVSAAQAGADAHNPAYAFRLDPRQVVTTTLPNYGFQPVTITSPPASPTPTPHVGADHRNVVKFVVTYGGKSYTVSVAQPAKQGPSGVWFIVTILPVAVP